MKCSACGSEWNTKVSISQIKNCPFCGCSLIKTTTPTVNVGISDVISQIIDQFGEDVILQKSRFISIFGDLAPHLKKEKRILSVAMDENIAELFLNCSPENWDASIVSSKRKLDGILSDSAIELVVTAFANAFGWEVRVESHQEISFESVDNSYSHSQNVVAGTTWDFKTPDDMLDKVNRLLTTDTSLFGFDVQRYTAENMDLEYQRACLHFNQEMYGNAFESFIKLLYPNPHNRTEIGSVLAGIKLALMYYLGDGIKKSQETAAHILFSLIPYKNPLVFAWISELFRIAVPGLTTKDVLLSREIYQKCSHSLNRMAFQGNPDAAYFIGFNLIYGINCDKNERQGFSYLRKSADAGNIRAKVDLALCYMDGKGIPTDMEKGIMLLHQLRDTQNSKAQYRLGLIYHLDKYKDYVTHNDSIALQYLMKAAKAGHSAAQDYVGDFYYYGNSVPVDYKEASHWYELSAKKGNVHASSQLGAMYYWGKGVDEDLDKSFHYLKTAADKGNTFSQYMLYRFYFANGPYKDYEMGRRYLEKAAESGDVEAQKLLSRMYMSDFGFNDEYKFVYWMKKAAEQGDAEAERIYGEAILYLGNDKVLKKDSAEALKWLNQAATHGDFDAMIDLVELYAEGDEVPKNPDIAFKMAKKALINITDALGITDIKAIKDEINFESLRKSVNKLAQALTLTGNLFLIDKMNSEAFQCYEMATSLEENGERYRLLGLCYKNGVGVKKDKKKAKELMKKAASLGDSIAQNELSKLFF